MGWVYARRCMIARDKDTFEAAQSTIWPKGGGEVGRMIRSKDWSKTPLGALENWESSLRVIVGVILNSRFPMMIMWGPNHLHIYNDAYRPMLRGKHPEALGAPAAEVWEEVWDDVAAPMVHQVMDGGAATWTEDMQLYIKGEDMLEETYFTFSFSPILGEYGEVLGLLSTVQETTTKVLSDRQIALLHELATHAIGNKSEGEAYRNIMNALSTYEADIPFALLFRYDEKIKSYHLSGATGLQQYEGPLKDDKRWPLQDAIDNRKEIIADISVSSFGVVPNNQHGTSSKQAIVLPLTRHGKDFQAALVIGISPHRKLDERYKKFFTSLLDQVATVILNARIIEIERRLSRSKR